jgi:hypothetical protein
MLEPLAFKKGNKKQHFYEWSLTFKNRVYLSPKLQEQMEKDLNLLEWALTFDPK